MNEWSFILWSHVCPQSCPLSETPVHLSDLGLGTIRSLSYLLAIGNMALTLKIIRGLLNTGIPRQPPAPH